MKLQKDVHGAAWTALNKKNKALAVLGETQKQVESLGKDKTLERETREARSKQAIEKATNDVQNLIDEVQQAPGLVDDLISTAYKKVQPVDSEIAQKAAIFSAKLSRMSIDQLTKALDANYQDKVLRHIISEHIVLDSHDLKGVRHDGLLNNLRIIDKENEPYLTDEEREVRTLSNQQSAVKNYADQAAELVLVELNDLTGGLNDDATAMKVKRQNLNHEVDLFERENLGQ